LALTLRDLEPFLNRGGVTELCINRPGEGFIESAQGWQRVVLSFAGFDWCLRLCKLVANATQQRIDEQSPLLSASLPDGERIQLAMPPATPAHTVSITIRKPAPRTWSLDELAQRGIFEHTKHADDALDPLQARLLALLDSRDYVEFMR
jgi:type IV secretion system protein VirB11